MINSMDINEIIKKSKELDDLIKKDKKLQEEMQKIKSQWSKILGDVNNASSEDLKSEWFSIQISRERKTTEEDQLENFKENFGIEDLDDAIALKLMPLFRQLKEGMENMIKDKLMSLANEEGVKADIKKKYDDFISARKENGILPLMSDQIELVRLANEDIDQIIAQMKSGKFSWLPIPEKYFDLAAREIKMQRNLTAKELNRMIHEKAASLGKKREAFKAKIESRKQKKPGVSDNITEVPKADIQPKALEVPKRDTQPKVLKVSSPQFFQQPPYIPPAKAQPTSPSIEVTKSSLPSTSKNPIKATPTKDAQLANKSEIVNKPAPPSKPITLSSTSSSKVDSKSIKSTDTPKKSSTKGTASLIQGWEMKRSQDNEKQTNPPPKTVSGTKPKSNPQDSGKKLK